MNAFTPLSQLTPRTKVLSGSKAWYRRSRIMIEPEISDEQLLRLIAQGSEVALSILYKRFKDRVYSLSWRILYDQNGVEETVQDVFVKIWQRAGDFSQLKGSVSSWVIAIAHHTAIDALRHREHRSTINLEDGELEQKAITEDRSKQMLERADIERALAKLEPTDRWLIEASYFEGLTQTQIASRENIPLGTVKTKMRSIFAQLRQTLKDFDA
jgi:RNA polymerase sigma-70 factor, ECF subfamily